MAEAWVVEYICGFRMQNGAQQYYVKWEGDWGAQTYTWEPLSNLQCEEKLFEFNVSLRKYFMSAAMGISGNNFVPDVVDNLAIDSNDLNIKVLNKQTLEILKHFLLKHISTFCKDYEICIIDNKLHFSTPPHQSMNLSTASTQKTTIITNKTLSDKINELKGPLEAPISIKNNVDTALFPNDFNYVVANKSLVKYSKGCDFVSSGCQCDECSVLACASSFKNYCCPSISSGKTEKDMFAYDANCCLRIIPGYPIYECGPQCLCDEDISKCQNRVVQNGRRFRLEIFRNINFNKAGWGVRTLQDIPANSFVLEYKGEIIDHVQWSLRLTKFQDQVDNNYITRAFELDFADSGTVSYILDANRFGNEGRFVNHSCDANLFIAPVFIGCNSDVNSPRIAFFAKRDILEKEELTFNYRGGNDLSIMIDTRKRKGVDLNSETVGEKQQAKQKPSALSSHAFGSEYITKRIRCKCGSDKCVYWLY